MLFRVRNLGLQASFRPLPTIVKDMITNKVIRVDGVEILWKSRKYIIVAWWANMSSSISRWRLKADNKYIKIRNFPFPIRKFQYSIFYVYSRQVPRLNCQNWGVSESKRIWCSLATFQVARVESLMTYWLWKSLPRERHCL